MTEQIKSAIEVINKYLTWSVMYSNSVSEEQAELEKSLIFLRDYVENTSKHDSELLDKVAEKFISWDSKVKGTREDGVCFFFTIENIMNGIEEIRMEKGVEE